MRRREYLINQKSHQNQGFDSDLYFDVCILRILSSDIHTIIHMQAQLDMYIISTLIIPKYQQIFFRNQVIIITLREIKKSTIYFNLNSSKKKNVEGASQDCMIHRKDQQLSIDMNFGNKIFDFEEDDFFSFSFFFQREKKRERGCMLVIIMLRGRL